MELSGCALDICIEGSETHHTEYVFFFPVAWAKLACTLLSAVNVLKGECHLDAANLDLHFLESRIVDMSVGSADEFWAGEGFQSSYNLD